MAAAKKAKLLYVMQLLIEKTDENNPVSVNQIIAELDKHGIKAERKSIYDDIQTLEDFGLYIERTREGGSYGYYIGERDFQMPELKLLVDSVQCAKFITQKKSVELIRKLEKLCSESQAKNLQREVIVSDRVKTLNENIYYITDIIHSAILSDHKISFKYFDWRVTEGDKKIVKEYRKGGEQYVVSPWALTWDDENYYLIAYNSNSDSIKHYRVDKMDTPDVLFEKRDGKSRMKDFNLASHAKKTFGMFGGDEHDVTLEFEDKLLGVVLDRFGSDVFISKVENGKFRVNVKAAISPVFYSWLFTFGTEVRVISPKKVVEEYRERAKFVAKLYKPDKSKKP